MSAWRRKGDEDSTGQKIRNEREGEKANRISILVKTREKTTALRLDGLGLHWDGKGLDALGSWTHCAFQERRALRSSARLFARPGESCCGLGISRAHPGVVRTSQLRKACASQGILLRHRISFPKFVVLRRLVQVLLFSAEVDVPVSSHHPHKSAIFTDIFTETPEIEGLRQEAAT